jgi:hypothetical protein
MARSQHDTLLPLDTYAQIMGLDPFTFNQIGLGFPEGSKIGLDGSNCADVFYQHFWHRNAISMDELALAIQSAEDKLGKALTYYPAPKYIVNEPIQRDNGRPFHRDCGLEAWSNLYYGYPYRFPYRSSVQTRFHKIQTGGTRARTFIADTADLTLFDSTTGLPAVAPNINDSFTCTVATSITNTNEIGVYFLPADRVPISTSVNESWRLRPLNVSISSGTATITGHATLLVRPALRTIPNPVPLDVTDATIYAGQLSVYRVYTDTDNAGVALWEAYDNCTETPCESVETTICMGNRNWKMGQAYIGYTENECCVNWRAPEQVRLSYLAGLPLTEDGQMQPEFAQYVAHLATGLLANFPCGCDRANKIIEWYRFDISSMDQEKGGRPLTPEEQSSPFGYSRGALEVWAQVAANEQITGVTA